MHAVSNFLALTFDIKPGSEQTVEQLFKDSGRPNHDVRDRDGNPVGRLLCTNVFMKDQTIVRVIEFDGEFISVARHMSQQQEVRELEEALDPYLAEPRDMRSPAGAAAFFTSAGMRLVVSRRAGS